MGALCPLSRKQFRTVKHLQKKAVENLILFIIYMINKWFNIYIIYIKPIGNDKFVKK